MLETGYNDDYEATAVIFFFFPFDAGDTARSANEKV